MPCGLPRRPALLNEPQARYVLQRTHRAENTDLVAQLERLRPIVHHRFGRLDSQQRPRARTQERPRPIACGYRGHRRCRIVSPRQDQHSTPLAPVSSATSGRKRPQRLPGVPYVPKHVGRQPNRIEQRIRPVPFSNVIELACAGKRPLGGHDARQPVVDEVGDEQQVRCLRQPLRWLGEKLVKAIHLHELNTRLLVQKVLPEPLYDRILDALPSESRGTDAAVP